MQLERQTSVLENVENDDYIKKYFIEEDREKGRKVDLLLNYLKKYFGGYITLLILIVLVIFPNYFYYIGINFFYDFI